MTGSTSGIGVNGFGDLAAITGLRGRLTGGREEQPSGEFVTPEQAGGLGLFLRSESAAQ